jgi:hypothetical protein
MRGPRYLLGIGLVAAATACAQRSDSDIVAVAEPTTTTTSEPTTTTSESPETTDTDIGVFLEGLRLGDCIDAPGYGSGDVGEITRVDCGSPHDAEVFGVPTLPGAPGAPYPGDDEVDTLSYDLCEGEFATFVGIDYLDSMWEFNYRYPTEETWRKYDDRGVVCFLNDPNLDKLEGSKRDSRT